MSSIDLFINMISPPRAAIILRKDADREKGQKILEKSLPEDPPEDPGKSFFNIFSGKICMY